MQDDDIHDLARLLDYEKEALGNLIIAWRSARQAQDWSTADTIRQALLEWQTDLGWVQIGQHHIVVEPARHVTARAVTRMRRFKVALYPWNRDAKGHLNSPEQAIEQCLRGYGSPH